MRKLVRNGIISVPAKLAIRRNGDAALSKLAAVDVRQISRVIMPKVVSALGGRDGVTIAFPSAPERAEI